MQPMLIRLVQLSSTAELPPLPYRSTRVDTALARASHHASANSFFHIKSPRPGQMRSSILCKIIRQCDMPTRHHCGCLQKTCNPQHQNAHASITNRASTAQLQRTTLATGNWPWQLTRQQQRCGHHLPYETVRIHIRYSILATRSPTA